MDDLKLKFQISADIKGLEQLETMIKALAETGANTNELEKNVADLRASWDKLRPEQQAQKISDLAKNYQQASQENSNYQKELNKSASDTANLNQASEQVTGTFSRMKGALIALGTALGVTFVVAKVKNFFTSATETAQDFEQQLAVVQAVSNASVEEMQRLSETAQALGASTRYTATQAAQGLEILARAGLSASDSIKALPDVLALAQGNSLDLAESAEFITKALAGMALETEEAGRVADVLAKASASANIDVRGLGSALSYAAPSAKALGVDLETTTAYLAKFADAGIDGSRAGTALNNILAQFSNPAGNFRRELANLGIRTENFNQAIHELAKRGDRAKTAIEALGLEAAPAMKALLNQGTASLDELNQKLRESSGFAQQQAETMNNTLSGAWAGLASAWESLKIKLASPILDPLRLKINELSEVIRDLVSSGKISALGEQISQSFKNGADAVINFVRHFDFSQLINKVGSAFKSLTTIFHSLIFVLQVLNKAWQILSITLNAFKSGLSAVGIALTSIFELITHGVNLVVKALDWFGSALGIQGDNLKNFSAQVNNFADSLADMRQEMVQYGAETSEAIGENFESLLGISDNVSNHLNNQLTEQDENIAQFRAEVKQENQALMQDLATVNAQIMGDINQQQEKSAQASREVFQKLGLDLDELFSGISQDANRAIGDYIYGLQEAKNAELDIGKIAIAGFEALGDKLQSSQEWSAFKQNLQDAGFSLDLLTEGQLKRLENNIQNLPNSAKTAFASFKAELQSLNGDGLKNFSQELEKAFNGGELSARQYGELLQELKLKTQELSTEQQKYGEVSAKVHQQAQEALQGEIKAKDELNSVNQNLQNSNQRLNSSQEKYGLTIGASKEALQNWAKSINLTDEQIKKLSDTQLDFINRSAGSFTTLSGVIERNNQSVKIVERMAETMRKNNQQLSAFQEKLNSSTYEAHELDYALRLVGNSDFNGLRQQILQAQQQLQQFRAEAKNTVRTLQAELDTLNGDVLAKTKLDGVRKIEDLQHKLDEARKRKDHQSAAELQKALNLQQQINQKNIEQQQERQRSSQQNQYRSNNQQKSNLAQQVVSAFDDRSEAIFAQGKRAGEEKLAREIIATAKGKPQ